MSDDKLDELLRRGRELEENAMAGRWTSNGRFVDAPPCGQVAEAYSRRDSCVDNAVLIAHMRNHWRALLDVVEAARKVVNTDCTTIGGIVDEQGRDLNRHKVPAWMVNDLRAALDRLVEEGGK